MIKWEKFVWDIDLIVKFLGSFLRTLAEKHQIDVLIIDCYGGVDTLTISAAGIADDFLVVNEPDVITFAGTLLLYKQLEATYRVSDRLPRVHFVINRVSTRYSFRFLQQEYKKNLSDLAIDRSILAYLPFDKLVFDTFGDYPFFSELLSKGLYAKKIRELIARLWPESPFVTVTKKAAWRRQRIYEATAENPLADPERIFQIWKTATGWALLPITSIILLYMGPRPTISFFTLRSVFYISLVFVLGIVVIVGLIEPWQVTRFLLRRSAYDRQRRRLTAGSTFGSSIRAACDSTFSWMPAAIGFLFCATTLLILLEMDLAYPFRNVRIWQGEIAGLAPNQDYRKLLLADGAIIKAGTDISGSHLEDSKLKSVLLPLVSLRDAHMRGIKLSHAKLLGAELNGADLGGCDSDLSSADFSGADAKVTSFQCADLTGAIFWGADLDRADFHGAYVYKTDFRQSILTNADFSNAVVLYPKLDGADLTGANFSAADFTYLNDNEKDDLVRLLESRGAKVKNPGVVANTNPRKGSADDWQTKLYTLLGNLTADTTGDTPAKTNLMEYLYGQIDYDHKIRYLSGCNKEKKLDACLQKVLSLSSDFATKADLIEYMLIQGARDDSKWQIARNALRDLTPGDETSAQTREENEGTICLLRLLLSIVSRDDKLAENTDAWRLWLKNKSGHRLEGWEWETWDTSFPARKHPEAIARVRAVQLSAGAATDSLQNLTGDQMTLWFGSPLPGAGSGLYRARAQDSVPLR